MMKIVQILPELNEGGVERGTVEMNREFVRKGLDSIVISAGGKFAETIIHDGGQHIKIDVCSKNPLTFPFRVQQLRQKLKQSAPDIVHVRSRVPAWLAYFANKSLNFKIVSTVHGLNSISAYSAIMQRADAVICVSSSVKEYIQQHYQTVEEKITTIPRGVDMAIFNPANLDNNFIEKFKDKYQLHQRIIFTSVGRITQLKDYETFIRAIARIKKKSQMDANTSQGLNEQNNQHSIIGLIVGGVREDKQEYFSSLKSLIKDLDVQDHIIFTGSQNKIAEIYALSDVVVSCSKKPESFGRSVAEAIALNTPVIATNHGGVKDIIRTGINGDLFRVGDEKELSKKLLNAVNLRFDGFDYIASTFSLENMVEKTLFIYEDLINNKESSV